MQRGRAGRRNRRGQRPQYPDGSVIKGLIRKEEIAYKNAAHITANFTPGQLEEKLRFRLALCEFIIRKLFEGARKEIQPENGGDTAPVLFSLVGL